MKFGPVELSRAEGAILAHSHQVGARRLRKGMRLGPDDIEALAQSGMQDVTVAILETGDLDENAAAAQIGLSGIGPQVEASTAFAGRVNFVAQGAGVLGVDVEAVNALNAIDPAITLATLPQFARVERGQLLATIKIIPYGVNGTLVEKAAAKIEGALQLHPVKRRQISLIMTSVENMKPSLLVKGRKAVETRLSRLGVVLEDCQTVPHSGADLASAIKAARGELVLVLTASATSDIEDVGPEAVRRAGGKVTRFGIPVDPGNLLFIGTQGKREVLGLPGCVRALALNGADWVLERLICGIPVDADMLADMGVGGLLKEIPTRPLPRRIKSKSASRRVAIVLLAAGQSRRMEGRDKLLEDVGDYSMLHHAAKAAVDSQATQVFVALPPSAEARSATLAGLAVTPIIAQDHEEGMGATLRNAMVHVGEEYDAVIVALADMPELTAKHYNQLIEAYDPDTQKEICRAVSEDGTPGHPVLFGRRFFENLALSSGDSGGRDILRNSTEFICHVKTSGRGAALDLDTPQAWQAWRDETR